MFRYFSGHLTNSVPGKKQEEQEEINFKEEGGESSFFLIPWARVNRIIFMTEDMNLNGKLWIETDGKKLIGPGRVELLERIRECGSIRQAALQMSMSYRQAWQMIDDMNTRLSAPVVISQRGGKGGGNAVVTEQGELVIAEFKLFYKRFQHFLTKNTHLIKLKGAAAEEN